jgi:hypothetical protein
MGQQQIAANPDPDRAHGGISNDIERQDAEDVERLYALLRTHFTEQQKFEDALPDQEDRTDGELTQNEIAMLTSAPFSVDKILLSGTEGSTALAHITRRLIDPTIPQGRRDTAVICEIKTRIFDTLVGSENRSLKPVGKNHYIARVRLQPGETTLSIMSLRWELQLPENTAAGDFLITLYRAPGISPELHVFAVADLLAEENPHLPAWLPEDLQIKTRKG